MTLLRHVLWLSLFFSFGFMPLKIDAAETLKNHFVFSIIAGNQAQVEAANLLKEAYRNIGFSVEYMSLPARRALEFSNTGRTDGEVFRIGSIDKKYPNLVRVPTPVMSFSGLAYSMKDFPIHSWQDLKNYRVGIIRGIAWSELGTRGIKTAYLDNNTALYKKLLSGGVDVIVGTSYSMEKEIKKRGDEAKIHRGKPLIQFDVYHFINKKHANIVDLVNAELVKLTATSKDGKPGFRSQ